MELYKKNHKKIDLVILDLIMPDMSAGETYNKMKTVNPEVKVLLASGYTVNGQVSNILENGCDGYIQKPFDMKMLSESINKILKKPAENNS